MVAWSHFLGWNLQACRISCGVPFPPCFSLLRNSQAKQNVQAEMEVGLGAWTRGGTRGLQGRGLVCFPLAGLLVSPDQPTANFQSKTKLWLPTIQIQADRSPKYTSSSFFEGNLSGGWNTREATSPKYMSSSFFEATIFGGRTAREATSRPEILL